mmetsp:Transcript_133677/g.236630  ORF Transcript_133677/g.236630 Transcript_133677/m.236630 type:complete len:210 (-) Transcript_133677:386-1015(-)
MRRRPSYSSMHWSASWIASSSRRTSSASLSKASSSEGSIASLTPHSARSEGTCNSLSSCSRMLAAPRTATNCNLNAASSAAFWAATCSAICSAAAQPSRRPTTSSPKREPELSRTACVRSRGIELNDASRGASAARASGGTLESAELISLAPCSLRESTACGSSGRTSATCGSSDAACMLKLAETMCSEVPCAALPRAALIGLSCMGLR